MGANPAPTAPPKSSKHRIFSIFKEHGHHAETWPSRNKADKASVRKKSAKSKVSPAAAPRQQNIIYDSDAASDEGLASESEIEAEDDSEESDSDAVSVAGLNYLVWEEYYRAEPLAPGAGYCVTTDTSVPKFKGSAFFRIAQTRQIGRVFQWINCSKQ